MLEKNGKTRAYLIVSWKVLTSLDRDGIFATVQVAMMQPSNHSSGNVVHLGGNARVTDGALQ